MCKNTWLNFLVFNLGFPVRNSGQPSPERVRFGSMRFTNLLKQIGSYPLNVQREAVEQAISKYQDFEQQRDDVTFIGVKVV